MEQGSRLCPGHSSRQGRLDLGFEGKKVYQLYKVVSLDSRVTLA